MFGFNSCFKTYVLFFALIFLCIGCSPLPLFEAPIIKKVESYQTAYVFPSTGPSLEGQKKFESIAFLESKKVAEKIISIPTKRVRIKRGWWASCYKLVPDALVVLVDRTPQTRHWTNSIDTGSTPNKDAPTVESKDSIAFASGTVCTAMIKEEDTSRFLYYYPNTEKRSLSDIMDTDIKGFVQSELSREFGKRNVIETEDNVKDSNSLGSCREDKVVIYKNVFKDVETHFARFGITITNLGNAEGLTYLDKEIQESINDKFKEEMKRKAQKDINERLVSEATAKRDAAMKFKEAWEASIMVKQLEIAATYAEATKTAAERWNGNTPANILPSGSGMLFNLDTNSTNTNIFNNLPTSKKQKTSNKVNKPNRTTTANMNNSNPHSTPKPNANTTVKNKVGTTANNLNRALDFLLTN